VILTGTYVPAESIKIADAITEMKPVKHAFENGIKARKEFEC